MLYPAHHLLGQTAAQIGFGGSLKAVATTLASIPEPTGATKVAAVVIGGIALGMIIGEKLSNSQKSSNNGSKK